MWHKDSCVRHCILDIVLLCESTRFIVVIGVVVGGGSGGGGGGAASAAATAAGHRFSWPLPVQNKVSWNYGTGESSGFTDHTSLKIV